MKSRCKLDGVKDKRYNERYYNRGIRVCDEWENWWPTFAEWALTHGYAHDLEIDRINNDEGYFPDNCRFVGHLEQNKNRDLKLTFENMHKAKLKQFAKPFMCVETGKVYQTQWEAFLDIHICRKLLRKCLRGVITDVHGTHWKYVEPTPIPN